MLHKFFKNLSFKCSVIETEIPYSESSKKSGKIGDSILSGFEYFMPSLDHDSEETPGNEGGRDMTKIPRPDQASPKAIWVPQWFS